ncbi:hypothetical protein V1520DRAFT_334854 [Lipomyces starkeyi]|uniref:3-oxoacyl-[acyl-carrier-protein] reductase n=1 Tax=Lipomyces starkeyi NRRL Y-11557 TaxID=675824 RepID=A0A1E3PYI6_LIPST|nr:hypothetical protein LIPSTDRAFT_106903 [Lipomyces starkeyi NRRL Y-11557]
MIIRRFIAHLPRRQIRYLSNAQPPLLDKHCLITGGSRGIGNAIATRLALEGASCVVLSRSIAAARQAIDKLDVTWRQIHIPVQFDVAKTTRVWTSADLGGVDLSSIDILVNAAGVAQNKLLFTTPGSEIEDIIRTNLMGTIFACRTFARPMTRRKEGGCIINISSVLAARGARGSAVYAASKAGIEGAFFIIRDFRYILCMKG